MATARVLLAAILLAFGPQRSFAACTDPAAVATARAAADQACTSLGTGCSTAKTHGQYVSCVAHQAKAAVKAGTLPKQCKGAVVKCAARSTCGKPGFATCCRTMKNGKTACAITPRACTPPKHGAACVGSAPSCCDACTAGGCASNTTTTTTTITVTSSTAPHERLTTSTSTSTTPVVSTTTAGPTTTASTSSSTTSNPCAVCDPNATCTPGGNPVCTCHPGYQGDGHTCTPVAVSLSGQRWQIPCGTDASASVCNCTDPAVQMATLGGAPGAQYDVALHFRGVVEEKTYTGGMADGFWYTGGSPAGDNWNVYRLDISDPAQTFFLNSGSSGLFYCVGLDYTRTVRVKTGAMVTLTALAIDNAEIKNIDSGGTPIVVPGVPPAPSPYNGQFVQMDVASVTLALITPP